MKAIKIQIIKSTLYLAVLFIPLTACSYGKAGPAFSPTIQISSRQIVGQSFVADWSGLNGIEVYLNNDGPLPDAVRVSLYTDVEDNLSLWAGDIPIPPEAGKSWFRIPIERQPESAGRPYYLTFEMKSDRKLALSTGPGGSYLNGALHRDGEPLDRQLDFRLKYHPINLALGVLINAAVASALPLGFAWLFTLPGWALFSGFWSAWEGKGILYKAILATGAGLALYPILLLLAWLVGLRIGPALVWILPIAAAGSFIWRYTQKTWKPGLETGRPGFGAGVTAIVFLGIIVSRVFPLQQLNVGMWGDSYHHTVITQLLIERGGLFSSWEPYAPLATFTYHYGFHTTAALLSWLLGLSADRSVVWAGQLLNILSVASLAPLVQIVLGLGESRPLTGSRRWLPGVVAAAAAGLIFPMPAYYINWGRYTQLAGQFLLVVWMIVAVEFFWSGKKGWKETLPAWVLLAGLGLTHYRVLIYAVLFIAAYWLIHIRRFGVPEAAALIWRVSWVAALLFLPWFWNAFGGKLMAILQTQLSTPAGSISEAVANYTQFSGNLTRFLPMPIWILLPVIIVWGLARRDRIVWLFSVWSLLLAALANPDALGLPGAGAVNNFAVLIAVYIPAAVVLGSGAAWIIEIIEERVSTFGPKAGWLGIAGVLLLVVWGGAGQIDLVKPRSHALVTHPDLEAFAWVRKNIPQEAIFLVNMIPAGGGGAVAGTDAGWWLPYYTQRSTVLPPYIFISEKSKDPNLMASLLDLAAALDRMAPVDAEMVDRLESLGVSHVYLGQRQGGVNSKGARIEIGSLLESSRFEERYHVDRVWIFELVPEEEEGRSDR